MEIKEKIERRQEFNRKILNIFHSFINSHPNVRFGQMLWNLDIDDKDWFYTESADMYEIINNAFKKLHKDE